MVVQYQLKSTTDPRNFETGSTSTIFTKTKTETMTTMAEEIDSVTNNEQITSKKAENQEIETIVLKNDSEIANLTGQ
jgi:hypothetical protein